MSRDQNVSRVEDLKNKERDLVGLIGGNPGNIVELLLRLAKIRLKLSSEEFLTTIRRLYSIESNNLPSKYLHARWHQKKAQINEALSIFSDVVDNCESNSELYDKSIFRRAECYFQQGYFRYARNLWNEYNVFRSKKFKIRSIVYLIFSHLFIDGDFGKVENLLRDGSKIDNSEVIIKVLKIFHRVTCGNVDLPSLSRALQEIHKITPDLPNVRFSPLVYYIRAKLFLLAQTKENIILALKELEEGIKYCGKKIVFRDESYILGLKFVLMGKLGMFSTLQNEFEKMKGLKEVNIFDYYQLKRYQLQSLHVEFRSGMEYEKMKELFNLCEEILDEEEIYKEKIQMIHPRILLEISNVYRSKTNKWVVGYELLRRADLILPNCVDIQIMLGWYTYYYLRQTEQSITILRESREKSKDWKVDLFLGEIYFREKIFDKALDFFQKSLEKENEDMVEMDKFRIGLKVAKCYHFIGKSVEKFEILDQLLLEIDKNKILQTQHMFLAQVYALDHSYTLAHEHLELIEDVDILTHEELKEYYNVMVEVIRKRRKKKPLLTFFRTFFCPKFRSFRADEVLKYLTVKSKCLIASSLIETGNVEEGNRIFNDLQVSLAKFLDHLYKEIPKKEVEEEEEGEGEEEEEEMKIGSLRAKIEKVQWDYLRYMVHRSRSYFECSKYEASLKELMVASGFLSERILVPKKKNKKLEKKKEDDHEGGKKKKGGGGGGHIYIPFHRKLVIRQLMFQKGLIYEKLGVTQKAVGEYTKIMVSFLKDKIELEKVHHHKDQEIRKQRVQVVGRKRHDYYLSALDHRSHCYLDLQQQQKAVEDLNALYHPDDPRTHLHAGLLGRIYETLTLWGPALKYYSISLQHLHSPSLRRELVRVDRRCSYDELYSNNMGFVKEEGLKERYIDNLFSRGKILFRMRNYVRTIDDMKIVLEHHSNNKNRSQSPLSEQNIEKLKETYHCLGYSHIHLNSGEEATKVFRDMIKQFPDDDRGFLARSRAHFVGGVNLRKSLEDLLSACRLNTRENREEKKSLLESYLKAVRRMFNMQIEAEFTLSKKLFLDYRNRCSSLGHCFRVIFTDDDIPVEDRCVYIHPLFTFVSSYLRREFVNQGIFEIQVGVRKRDDPNLWDAHVLLRDWIMCLGIQDEMKRKLLEDVFFLEKVYFLARKFELNGLLCFLVREYNPFILQDHHQKESEKFKKDILSLSLRLLERKETDTMLFLNCIGFFRYLIDVDERKSKLEAFRSRNSPDRSKSAPVRLNNMGRPVVDQSSEEKKNTIATGGGGKEGECDFLFQRGEEMDERMNELRIDLVEKVREKEQGVDRRGMSFSVTPVDYLRLLLEKHPNYMKRKIDSQPSTIYEKLLMFVWSNEETFRNLWIKDMDGKVTKAHTEVLLTKMSFFREMFKTEEILEEGYVDEGRRRHKNLSLDDVPNKILQLMMGFCYKERETVRNFDISSWGKEEFDELMDLVRKYKMNRFEIVLMLKYLKEMTKDW